MKAENVIGPASIIERPEQTYIGLRFESPFRGMFARATQALKELRKLADTTQGLSGPATYFLRYYHCDMRCTMDVEAGLMTAAARPGDGRIRPGTLPPGRYASLVYRGNGLRGNQALMQWAKDRGLAFAPLVHGAMESYACRLEAYLTDHRVEPRKLLWDVELSILLADDRAGALTGEDPLSPAARR